jgi:hypothetical protein
VTFAVADASKPPRLEDAVAVVRNGEPPKTSVLSICELSRTIDRKEGAFKP